MSSAVFILGPGRSYTTVTAGMLGQHPELFGVPELNLAIADSVEQWLVGAGRPGAVYRHGVLRTLAQFMEGEQSVGSVSRAGAWLIENRHLSTGDLMRMIAEHVAPRRIVEKSPLHVVRDDYLARLDRFFPDARYIHIVRHPMTSCTSMMKADWYQNLLRSGVAESWDRRTAPAVFDPQVHWYDTHDRILRFLSQFPPERQRRVRGEDVLSDTRSIAELCRWLGIDDGPSAIEAMRHPEQSPFACEGPPNARWGNDPSYQKSPALRPYSPTPASLSESLPWRQDGQGLAPVVVEMAREFGYADSPSVSQAAHA